MGDWASLNEMAGVGEVAGVGEAAGRRGSLTRLAALLRELPRPIIGRLAEKALWLDLRCLEAADEAEFIAQWNSFGR